MKYQCNKLTAIPYSDEVKSAHKLGLSQKQMASSKILYQTEVQTSSVGDGDSPQNNSQCVSRQEQQCVHSFVVILESARVEHSLGACLVAETRGRYIC